MYSSFIKAEWCAGYNVLKRVERIFILATCTYQNQYIFDLLFSCLTALITAWFTKKVEDNINKKKPGYRRSYKPMSNTTKSLLDNFFKPFNKQLEEMLHRKFWN